MDKNSKIFLAGHRGLVGSALNKRLQEAGYRNILTRSRSQLDLTDGLAVREFFSAEKPEVVILAAAKVGGIAANNDQPFDFVSENLEIQHNVITNSYRIGAQNLIFLGSSCIYPRSAPQPIREEYLLTGQLESTNRPYAIAKIAGIEMRWSLNRQHHTKYLAIMPSNLYGPGDNYDGRASHVIPALIKKFHEAKILGLKTVKIWGTGTPRREFLYSEDFADAVVRLLEISHVQISQVVNVNSNIEAPLINIGSGRDLSIIDLAKKIAKVVGFDGSIETDPLMPDGTPQKVMDVSKIKSIGWFPKTSLEDGLRRAYLDFLNQNQSQ